MQFKERKAEAVALKIGEVALAKADRSHIAIRTLDSIDVGHWKSLKRKLGETREAGEYERLAWNAFVPFSEALEGKKFTLEPLEIVSIWSRAMEVFPKNRDTIGDYPRHALSLGLAFAYGSQPLNLENWGHLLRGTVLHGSGSQYFESVMKSNHTGALKFNRRFLEIDRSLKALEEYNIREGHDTLLNEIHENWGNGMYWMAYMLPVST